MMRVKFWGVRGSIPSAEPSRAAVGGNTACLEVRCGDELLILDAGTGLRGLGGELMRAGGAPRATLLLSHLHWDHIQGFPFFVPAFVPGARIDVLGPAPDGLGGGVRAALDAQMRPPFFPVTLAAMRAELGFRTVGEAEELEVGSIRIRSAAAHHPNGCLAYRIEAGGAVLTYATDTEHEAGGPPDAGLVRLAEGADLVVYDAQYTPEEHRTRRGWGHSTAEEGVRLVREAGATRLALFHHDPAHDDAAVAQIEAGARRALPGAFAAREGMVLELGGESVSLAA